MTLRLLLFMMKLLKYRVLLLVWRRGKLCCESLMPCKQRMLLVCKYSCLPREPVTQGDSSVHRGCGLAG